MLKVYKCNTECTWNGNYWKEGTLTRLLDSDTVPPKEYFKPVTDREELNEVLENVDPEDDPKTFEEISRQLMDAGNTGVGICAGDLRLHNFNQLKKMAKDLGVFDETIKSKDDLIEAIEKAGNE